MFRKIILTLVLTLMPLSMAFAAGDPVPLIGGTLLPGIQEDIQAAVENQTSSVAGEKLSAGEKKLRWLQNTFLRNIINQLIGWTAALAVVFLVIGGYQYLTAVGNEEQIKQAHKTIIWSLAGMFFALIAFAIVQILVNIDFDPGPTPPTATTATTTATTAQQSVSSSSTSTLAPNGVKLEVESTAGTLSLGGDKLGDFGAPIETIASEADSSVVTIEEHYTDGGPGSAGDAAGNAKTILETGNTVSTSMLSADITAIDPMKEILPFAQDIWEGEQAVKGLPKGDFKTEFLPIVTRFLVYGIAFIAFIVFFIAGAMLVLGWGEEESINKAKSAIEWGISGLIFAAASYALVKGLLGVDLSWDEKVALDANSNIQVEETVGVETATVVSSQADTTSDGNTVSSSVDAETPADEPVPVEVETGGYILEEYRYSKKEKWKEGEKYIKTFIEDYKDTVEKILKDIELKNSEKSIHVTMLWLATMSETGRHYSNGAKQLRYYVGVLIRDDNGYKEVSDDELETFYFDDDMTYLGYQSVFKNALAEALTKYKKTREAE